jgi:hypothetical protein
MRTTAPASLARTHRAAPRPPQGRLAPRRFKPIPDDAPARELGEYLRAMIRSREDMTLDKLAAAGGLAKTTLTTTMDGRSKEWAAVQRLIDAYLAFTGEADLTARAYDEIRRLYRVGRTNHAARQRREGRPVKSAAASAAASVAATPESPPLPPFYAAKVVRRTVKLPRRTPGAGIDPSRRVFLPVDEVSARVDEIRRLRRLAERYKAHAAAATRTRGRVAVTGRATPGGAPMPGLCRLDAAEAAALLARGPWVSVHQDLYQGISFLFEDHDPTTPQPEASEPATAGPAEGRTATVGLAADGPAAGDWGKPGTGRTPVVFTVDRSEASQFPWPAPGWHRPATPASSPPPAMTVAWSPAPLWRQLYPLLLIAAGIALLPVSELRPLGAAALATAAGILGLRLHPITAAQPARTEVIGPG